tara:strand:- start:22420 stop:26193 length:3774 start_codon:yes stop_codon:yes gene_type:complete
MVDKCFEDEIVDPTINPDGDDDGADETEGDDGEPVNPADVGSNNTLEQNAEDEEGPAEDLRPIEPTSNFLTEDKTIKAPTSAVSRKKIMMLSTHFINGRNALLHLNQKFSRENTRNVSSTSDIQRLAIRYPQEAHKYQDEYQFKHDIEADEEYGPMPDGQSTSAGLTMGAMDTAKRNHSIAYNTVDPLMYCLGGYYKSPRLRSNDSTVIYQHRPSNNKGEIGNAEGLVLEYPHATFGDQFPFQVSVKSVSNDFVSSMSNINGRPFFSDPGLKERITFDFREVNMFNPNVESNDSVIARVGSYSGIYITEALANISSYIFGESIGRYPFKFPNNHINMVTPNKVYEHFDFVTDMPFFDTEVEKINTMKNLTVSTRLESNFVTSEYRRYGNSQGEREVTLPSIYTLSTLDKVKDLPREEQDDFYEKMQKVEGDRLFEKMLFTASDVNQFKSVNDEFKVKVPMYVEFDIGTNQGSPMAEMLSVTGLDKMFLQFLSQETLDRTNGQPFAEVITGTSNETGELPSGARQLTISEGTDGNKIVTFNFMNWLNMFFGDVYEDKQTLQKSLIRNTGGQVATVEEVREMDNNDLAMAAAQLESAFRTRIRELFEALPEEQYSRNVEDPNADNLSDATSISRFLANLSTASTGYTHFMGRRDDRRYPLREAFETYNATIERTVNNRASTQRDLIDQIASNKEEKQRLIDEMMRGIDIKNFPLKMESDISNFNQFKMLIQALSLKGKIDTKYRSLFRSYKELIDGSKMFAHSETLGYRIDKHKVDNDGGVETTPVQSFYMMDSDGIENINFIDSQIIFGQRYIYRIYAYDFVVGTQYKYDSVLSREDGSMLTSLTRGPSGNRIEFFQEVNAMHSYGLEENQVSLFVNSMPIYKIVEIPYLEKEIIVIDRPPMFPEVKFYPLKDNKNMFKVCLQATSGERRLDPIAIEDRDSALIEDMRRIQGVPAGEPIFYESDDLPTNYEVFRTTAAPLSYENFKGRMIRTAPSENASATDFYDYVVPNIKYYYTFRAIDKSGNMSNPSIVYQVEIIDHEDYCYLDVRPYSFPKAQRTFIDKFERLLFIRASSNQRSFEMGDDPSTSDVAEMGSFGRNSGPEGSIFTKGRRFKVRIKSKHSQKKIDLNLSFTEDVRVNNETILDPATLAEAARTQLLSANIDFARMNTAFGPEYEKFIANFLENAQIIMGEDVQRFADTVRQNRLGAITNPTPSAGPSRGGSSGGGSSGGGSPGGGGMGGSSGGGSPGGGGTGYSSG